jgi:hypothetical protein
MGNAVVLIVVDARHDRHAGSGFDQGQRHDGYSPDGAGAASTALVLRRDLA